MTTAHRDAAIPLPQTGLAERFITVTMIAKDRLICRGAEFKKATGSSAPNMQITSRGFAHENKKAENVGIRVGNNWGNKIGLAELKVLLIHEWQSR